MSNSRKLMVFFLFISIVLAGHISGSFGFQDQPVDVSVEKLTQSFGGSWQKAFAYVRDKIRFEPSTYLMKSPQGLLWGLSGNAKEQAFLLSTLMQGMGVDVRTVSGRLSSVQASSLIRSMFSETDGFSYAKEIPLSHPSEDEALVARVAGHYWVQIQEDGQWLDLDPCFPDAQPGTAYTAIEKTFASPPDRSFPKMKISLSVQKGDSREEVLTLEQKLQEMVNQPISLSISSHFKEAEGKESGGGSIGGGFGRLSGGASRENAKKGLLATYRAVLNIKEGMKISGEFTEKIPEPSQQTSTDDVINRVWISFRLALDGIPLIESERILFEKLQSEDEFPLFQRHSILIAPNAVPQESWEDDLAGITDDRLLKQIKSSIDEIKESVESTDDKDAILDQSLSLEEKLGRDLGHLINMIFAYTSDTISADAGKALSVYSYYSLPRIIITSVEGDGEKVKTVMDLRHDKIEALSFPGQALGMSGTFLYGRGVFESVLEGKVLELFLGKRALTTAYIMQQAAEKKTPVRFFSEQEKEELEKLPMPEHVSRRAIKAMEDGYILVVPDQGVQFDDRERWGWWQVNPRTQEVIGVLDTGLHQAMLSRTVLDTKGMLNSKMGFVIGAITGAVDTQWMLATMVLKYGEINKAALQEIKAYMKQLKAYMCPEFERSVSVTIASVEVINIEDCYKKEYSWGYEGGVKVEMGWCQSFAKGFGCASTSILNYYLSQYD